MGLVNAKCLNCGANLKVDNQSKTGTCEHCGARYITEDVIINNITNIGNRGLNLYFSKLDDDIINNIYSIIAYIC